MMKFFEYIYGFETIIYEYVNRKEFIFQNLIIMAYLVIILKSKENIISETSMI